MPRLRPVDYRVLVRIFEKGGFQFNRQTGDHLIFSKPGFLTLDRSEATESGADARRATMARAVVLVQYVEQAEERQRSRRVVFRRRSRGSVRNAG